MSKKIKTKEQQQQQKKNLQKQNETKQGNTENAGCFQVTLGFVFWSSCLGILGAGAVRKNPATSTASKTPWELSICLKWPGKG